MPSLINHDDVERALRNVSDATLAPLRTKFAKLGTEWHRIGSRRFRRCFGGVEVELVFNRPHGPTLVYEATFDEALALALNLARAVWRSAGRGRNVIDIVVVGS